MNISPTEESYFESLCSLRFASQVNQCELGKAKRHIKDLSAAEASKAMDGSNPNSTLSSLTAPVAAPLLKSKSMLLSPTSSADKNSREAATRPATMSATASSRGKRSKLI